MKKKVIITVSVVLALLLTILLLVVIIPEKNYDSIRNMQINNVDLGSLDDGTYKGEFPYGHYTYKVEVEVKDHKMINIVVDHGRKSKRAKQAEGVIDHIITEQKVDVDVVSGATTTSKAILKAVEIALSGNVK